MSINVKYIKICRNKGWFDWFPSWKPTSLEHLAQAETELLNCKLLIYLL